MTVLIVRHLLVSGVGVGAVLAIALALRLLAPQDAVLRYRLLVAALFTAALLLPLQAITAELAPRHDVAPSPRFPAAPVSAPSSVSGPMPALAERGAPALGVGPGLSFATAAGPSGDNLANSASTLLSLYLAGAFAVLGLRVVRFLAVRRLLRRARPVTDPRVLEVWGRIIADLRHPPALLECDGLHSPACCAMGRPAVIVPPHAGALDHDTLVAALRHELVHLRRRDGAVALVAAVIATILWFHPLVWIFCRVLRTEREHSCDALVVRMTRQPRSYALALLRFCGPPTSGRPVASLIGFESARSIRRRISMLAHALQPAARRRNAMAVGVGLASLVSISAAHALLTAAAGPGPALVTEPAAKAKNATATTEDKAPPSPRMTSEVLAAADGRSDLEVYTRLVKRGVIVPRNLPPRDGFAVFFKPSEDKSSGVRSGLRPKLATVTDQETVLSAQNARADGDVLYADRADLRLPDGSKLRALFEGRTIKAEPGAKGETRIVVTAGTVRIVDDRGFTRVEILADPEHRDTTMILTSFSENGATRFQLAATDGTRPVFIRMNIRTGVPASNRDSLHGDVGWNLVVPEGGPGTCELNVQWTYDLGQLASASGC